MKHSFLCNCRCHTNDSIKHVAACCTTYRLEDCTCKEDTLTAKRYCPWHGITTNARHHKMFEDLKSGLRYIHPLTNQIQMR